MNKNNGKKVEESTTHVSVNKRADIWQATFEHYYKMAIDHHTKAAITSNILLVIVGALLVFVGLDERICCSGEDIGSASAVILIGFFGAMWVWKQHERYHYWEFIAIKFQEELKKIMPTLETRHTFNEGAEDYAAKRFGKFFTKTLKDRFLWLILHVIVMIIGVIVLIISLCNTCPKYCF
jgi:hypothetical protein